MLNYQLIIYQLLLYVQQPIILLLITIIINYFYDSSNYLVASSHSLIIGSIPKYISKNYKDALTNIANGAAALETLNILSYSKNSALLSTNYLTEFTVF